MSCGEGTSVCVSWMSIYSPHYWPPLPSWAHFTLRLLLCPLPGILFLQKSAWLLSELFWGLCSCIPFSVRPSVLSTRLETAFPVTLPYIFVLASDILYSFLTGFFVCLFFCFLLVSLLPEQKLHEGWGFICLVHWLDRDTRLDDDKISKITGKSFVIQDTQVVIEVAQVNYIIYQ